MTHRSRLSVEVDFNRSGNDLNRPTPYTTRIHPLYAVALQGSKVGICLNREVVS